MADKFYEKHKNDLVKQKPPTKEETEKALKKLEKILKTLQTDN
jgi:hypothetical protein